MAEKSKADWSRCGDSVAGGRIIICDVHEGDFGLEKPMTLYSKKKNVLPIPSRIVIFEKTIKIQELIDDFREEMFDTILQQSADRMQRQLKEIDDKFAEKMRDAEFPLKRLWKYLIKKIKQ